MTAWYTTLCTICEHPIKKGAESAAHWHHDDAGVCRDNIRADERQRLYGGQGWVAQKDVEAWLTGLRANLEARAVEIEAEAEKEGRDNPTLRTIKLIRAQGMRDAIAVVQGEAR
jgi:hypothetical protein